MRKSFFLEFFSFPNILWVTNEDVLNWEMEQLGVGVKGSERDMK